MIKKRIKAGDFTSLAKDYSAYRPDYSSSVCRALISLLDKPKKAIKFVDVGAGTGIWTRMVNEHGIESTIAIEPNEAMRDLGKKDSINTSIKWFEGNAEHTGLEDCSADLVTMASSFHWADFDGATKEFYRILKPEGRFTALWNPRVIEENPLLVEIENYLSYLKPDLKRVSSGKSGITETLSERLIQSPLFEDVVYLEGRHVIHMTVDRYVGAWKSVNDIKVQLGEDKFSEFLKFVIKKTSDMNFIDATYITRAWSCARRG